MFSTEKCSGHSGTGTSEESELFTGGREILGKEGVPTDDVASAVAAVSDEIGDILKDELGDADRAERIGAELADLSAELGLLAGLADGETQQSFPSLFEIAMGHRGSASGSSTTSSSWSGSRSGRGRRSSRTQRASRRRPIAKGKEVSRRRSAAARRAASMRVRRVEVVSDASDVGADSDSDDQWTELDDGSGSSDSSSVKATASQVDCNGYQHSGAEAEAPIMGQFLLPLLSADPTGPEPEHFLIRHEDILQLLASAEGSARDEVQPEDDIPIEITPDMLPSDMYVCEEPTVTPEDEAALLHYVCESERMACEGQSEQFIPVEEWLLGVYHSWCEISALMYTLIGTNMSVERVTEEWVYRARFGCHCRLCLCLANNCAALEAFLRDLVVALAHGSTTVRAAANMVRALGLRAGAGREEDGPRLCPTEWDLLRLYRTHFSDEGEGIIHQHLCRLAQQNEIAAHIVNKVCLCREDGHPFEKQYAVDRFLKILEHFKGASTITYKVEMVPSSDSCAWVQNAQKRLSRYLQSFQCSTSDRLRHMAARSTPRDLNAWSGYKHRCDCLTPRTLCAQQRKQLLRISFYGMMQAVNEFNGTKADDATDKLSNDVQPETAGRELQQGDGTGAKPPDNVEPESVPEVDTEQQEEHSDHKSIEHADEITDSDANSGTASLGLSTSSSLDSASELLLAAAAAVESGGSEGEAAPGELCRTVRHLMRSIASIERLMDRVLKHCDEWPTPPSRNDLEAKKRVDMGLSEVDRKLMAMYRRLPEVHRRQLQVYRKQKKLSTVCMQLVGGRAPAPPPPGSPPPTPAHQSCRALCPEYHLQRFKEVRRKVMHMRDQQLYYHRLRMWLEDQLRHERESQPESNVTLVEELPRRKRRTASPKVPRLTTAAKRKLKPVTPCISKPQRILQMLKHKAPAQTTQLLTEGLKLDKLKENDDEPSQKSEAEPPEAFPLEKEDNISDTDTIVGEKETGDLCKEMKDCLAKFANFALNSPDNRDYNLQPETETKYPESVSPPLQEMSPTTSEPMPVYTPKPNQRLLAVNKFLNISNEEKIIEFQSQVVPEVLNVPLNARRTPLLVKDESGKDTRINNEDNQGPNSVFDTEKDPNLYKYVTFGFKIKNAMEECQNIINSYNSVKDERKDKIDDSKDGPLSLEQICEVMMNLDENSAQFLEKIDCDDATDLTTANSKLAELVENMPQILANMPEIASKLSEFANASFELPEFASIMNSLPDVNNEAQLTPETLKQIRELKSNKCRDNVKVTKNTAKRKCNRRIKNNIESDVIGTMTFEIESIDIADILKDEKEFHALMKNKSKSKEDFKDILFSVSAQVVINKVREYVKQSKSSDLAKCLEDKDFFAIRKNCNNSEIYSKASTLFDNSVKDARSMDELRELVKSRFISWKHLVLTKFKGIPSDLLQTEIETMLHKFYSYIKDLSDKQCANDKDKISEKLEDLLKNNYDRATTEESVEKLKNKLFITKSGNVFDMLIMKLSKRSQDQKYQDEKYEYMDVVKRCADSQKLPGWILTDPDVAANVIREVTGLPVSKIDNIPNFNSTPNNQKRDYFLARLKEMNRAYMDTLPKKSLTGDEWLVMLYRLEQLEENIKGALTKVNPPARPVVHNEVQNTNEAEILVAKGLSKILGNQCNIRVVKKNQEQPKPEKVENLTEKIETEPPRQNIDNSDHKSKSDALLAKCESILMSKGEKSLLDSFYLIKSYITQGLPVPELYKQHVMSIYSNIDWKSLDEDIDETLKEKQDGIKLVQNNVVSDSNSNKDKNPISVGTQSPEMLAKYSAQALRNAKQTLNAVAFRNMVRNGQSKSESDACDTPKTDCKWTSDCICNNCKVNDMSSSGCLGDIVKQCCDADPKSKNGLESKKEVKLANNKPSVKQTKSKSCENATHQQHVCKGGNGGSTACAGDSNADQPCTCCYCTVFGHAPPLTTPVPRNFNETRERLRSILNKKKQKCKTTNGEPEVQEKKQVGVQTQTPDNLAAAKQKPLPQPSPKPPALPKTLPPNLTPQAQQKRQNLDSQQKQLAEGIAKLTVSDDAAENKPKVPERPPVPPNVSSAIKTEGKVNPNAMEQIRLQQLKQQQIQYQQQQQMLQQQMAAAQQKKPEPIYDLPIHNRPKLTPEQQQQILHQQLLLQQQNEQRQSRAQQQRNASVSSRASSLFSTSSGCSGDSCWRGDSACREDPRDLDALLQYIEGPTRHVDRGKKRAKKQRQKAKKMEARLLEEVSDLTGELSRRKAEALELQRVLVAARRHADEAAQALQNHHKKTKGKKNKQNAGHQAKTVMLMEKLGEAQGLKTIATKELQDAERRVAECLRQLQECELQLAETRAVQLQQNMEQSVGAQKQQPANYQQQQDQLQQQMRQQQQQQMQLQQQIQQQQQQHLQHRQQQQQLERQMQLKQLEIERKNAEMLDPTTFLLSGGSGGDLVRVRRSLGDGTVTVSLPHGGDLPLARLLQNNQHLTVLNVREDQSTPPAPAQPPKPVEQKKQTWEQALAHINQLAKGNKDKKKQKEARQQKQEVKPVKEQPKPAPVVETQPLSKKQRKLLVKQQAEEEERLKQQQEAKSKKNEIKKQENDKVETSKKSDKATELNKKVDTQKKKEDKIDNKKQEKATEKKGKENKTEKSATSKQEKQAPQPQQKSQTNTKKEGKKKDQLQKQVINITPDTTIEMVDKMNTCHSDMEKPASCSIMEQLSCGVQVADLKLPPGITLTRVQPNEKKEPPQIKSVPLWKCNQLPATPTPVARPAPVINADPAMMMFTTAQPEQPKSVIMAEPQPQPTGKSKKAKKKAKKAAAAAEVNETAKQDGTKMVTLRNPMFHPNLPPVQISNNPVQKKTEPIRVPDPITMPPNPCQATITPTSNGMYTIRNPLMSMMHQQNLMGMMNQRPQMNPVFGQPQFNYVNPNVYNPVQSVPPPQTYVLDPSRNSPKNQDELQNRIMNLASFTQKNDEGYSLFKAPEDNQQRSFLAPEHFPENQPPKPVVSPNPIGTRPNNELNRSFDSNDSSLFSNSIQRPEPIGTPLKREEDRNDFTGGLYTPFGQEDRNVFRNALFDKSDGSNVGKLDDVGPNQMCNGDPLPYFQQLRVGSKLNNEVTVHHVTESKFYKGQEATVPLQPLEKPLRPLDESLFSRPIGNSWQEGPYGSSALNNKIVGGQSSCSSSVGDTTSISASASVSAASAADSGGASPHEEEPGFGPIGARQRHPAESSVFLPNRSITNLSSLEVSEREIESFKRFDFYFEPPRNKPKVQLDVRDIAAALKQNHK